MVAKWKALSLNGKLRIVTLETGIILGTVEIFWNTLRNSDFRNKQTKISCSDDEPCDSVWKVRIIRSDILKKEVETFAIHSSTWEKLTNTIWKTGTPRKLLCGQRDCRSPIGQCLCTQRIASRGRNSPIFHPTINTAGSVTLCWNRVGQGLFRDSCLTAVQICVLRRRCNCRWQSFYVKITIFWANLEGEGGALKQYSSKSFYWYI